MRIKNKITYFVILFAGVLLSGCSSTRYAVSAFKSYQIGEYHDAIVKYMKAYRKEKSQSKRTEYNYYLVNAYWCLDDYKKAELRIRNLLRKNYPDSSLILKYANALRAEGKYEEAIKYYKQFLDTVPNNQEALYGIEACKIIPGWEANPTRFEVKKEQMLNSRDADFSPWFVGGLDNNIIFTSTREGAAGKKKSAITGQRNADLFRSNFDIQKQRWEKPTPIDDEQLINTTSEEGAASMSKDGNTLYFTRCKFDKRGSNGAAVYTAIKSKDAWSEAESLGLLSDSLIAAHPSISNDGQTLYFVSDMDGGYGGKDIWRISKISDGWSEPENLGPDINTPGNEMFPFIRDNGELYFSSDYWPGMGGLDIFKATFISDKENEKGKWAVENMKVPVNSSGDDFGITFIPGRDQGMFSSNRKGSRGDDLYSFILPPKIFRTEGKIVNSETGSRVKNAYVRVIGTDGTMLKVRSEDGKFQFRMSPETDYIFAAFKEGYLNAKQIISTINLSDSKIFEIQLNLTPTDAPVKVDNINYGFGKSGLQSSSIKALDSLVDILNINPTIVIEIMSHTDFVGSVRFNSELSQKRAQGVVNYLIEKGINPQRLVAKGYGETWPKTVTRKLAKEYDFLKRGDVLDEKFIMALPTKEQQEIAKGIDRRTEFKVLRNDFRETYSPR